VFVASEDSLNWKILQLQLLVVVHIRIDLVKVNPAGKELAM
jgi:hypothetical protein